MKNTIWSPIRIAIFLATWSLVTPIRIQISQTSHSLNVLVWAGAWGLGRVSPFTDSPLVIDPAYTLFMFPYCVPGLAIAWLVWRGARDGNLTKSQYIERTLLLQVVHMVLVWLFFPCPYSSGTAITCIPVPTTGIVAMPFVTRVVKELLSPWQALPPN